MLKAVVNWFRTMPIPGETRKCRIKQYMIDGEISHVLYRGIRGMHQGKVFNIESLYDGILIDAKNGMYINRDNLSAGHVSDLPEYIRDDLKFFLPTRIMDGRLSVITHYCGDSIKPIGSEFWKVNKISSVGVLRPINDIST